MYMTDDRQAVNGLVTLKLPVRLSEAARMKVKVTLLVRREEMGQKLTARSILRI